MSGYQRSIWVTSVLYILFGLSLFALSIIGLLLGSGSLGGGYSGLLLTPMSGLFVFASILGICQAIFQFVVGCIGVRHADDPATTEALYVLGIIDFISACVTCAFFAFNMGTIGAVDPLWTTLCALVSAIVGAVFMYSAGRANAGARHPMVY